VICGCDPWARSWLVGAAVTTITHTFTFMSSVDVTILLSRSRIWLAVIILANAVDSCSTSTTPCAHTHRATSMERQICIFTIHTHTHTHTHTPHAHTHTHHHLSRVCNHWILLAATLYFFQSSTTRLRSRIPKNARLLFSSVSPTAALRVPPPPRHDGSTTPS
jgi:hypothetical protein